MNPVLSLEWTTKLSFTIHSYTQRSLSSVLSSYASWALSHKYQFLTGKICVKDWPVPNGWRYCRAAAPLLPHTKYKYKKHRFLLTWWYEMFYLIYSSVDTSQWWLVEWNFEKWSKNVRVLLKIKINEKFRTWNLNWISEPWNMYLYLCIQGVTGGMCETSGECSLGQTIPI